jgi:hypothetical protein
VQFRLRLRSIQRLVVDGNQASHSTLAGFDNFFGGVGISGLFTQ